MQPFCSELHGKPVRNGKEKYSQKASWGSSVEDVSLSNRINDIFAFELNHKHAHSGAR
jgi:hypothetical protein